LEKEEVQDVRSALKCTIAFTFNNLTDALLTNRELLQH